MDLYSIVSLIKRNAKRMNVLSNIGSVLARREQAYAYVVAECREQKIKLSQGDKIKATVLVLNA